MDNHEVRCPKKGCRGNIEPNWVSQPSGIEHSSGLMEAGEYDDGKYAIEQDMRLYHCTSCGCQFAIED